MAFSNFTVIYGKIGQKCSNQTKAAMKLPTNRGKRT